MVRECQRNLATPPAAALQYAALKPGLVRVEIEPHHVDTRAHRIGGEPGRVLKIHRRFGTDQFRLQILIG